MTTVSLQMPYPPKQVHPNHRPRWWGEKAQATQLYREQCCYVAKMARAGKGWIKLQPPVTATVTFYAREKRNRDEDNLLASIKGGIDGLVDSGLIQADDADALHIVLGGIVVGRERCVRVELVAL